jgi:hypothetical protein
MSTSCRTRTNFFIPTQKESMRSMSKMMTMNTSKRTPRKRERRKRTNRRMVGPIFSSSLIDLYMFDEKSLLNED